ncbi:hypothetical protein DV706_09105 [Natronorubrum bangense]|uniref:Uncharacterized protein n=2 Tax=Natronorubrum bangense TaxID=61858 RepID=L9WPK9_9EURY|nr:hypothetical protein C494_03720 [Natronorubrum bangense JCM 10635]QCC54611.1 hypothetical protein DV706_09105 [Natronorubrum bangense]
MVPTSPSTVSIVNARVGLPEKTSSPQLERFPGPGKEQADEDGGDRERRGPDGDGYRSNRASSSVFAPDHHPDGVPLRWESVRWPAGRPFDLAAGWRTPNQ